MPKPARVSTWVCTFNPRHTLACAVEQEAAVRDGRVAAAVADHGAGSVQLAAWFAREGLVSMRHDIDGDGLRCASCNASMEYVAGPDDVTDRVEALRDIAENFGGALQRTRDLREESK